MKYFLNMHYRVSKTCHINSIEYKTIYSSGFQTFSSFGALLELNFSYRAPDTINDFFLDKIKNRTF